MKNWNPERYPIKYEDKQLRAWSAHDYDEATPPVPPTLFFGTEEDHSFIIGTGVTVSETIPGVYEGGYYPNRFKIFLVRNSIDRG